MYSPAAGVLIADYVLVKRMRIDLVALFETKGRYWYWQGVSKVAVIWMALGFLAYMFVIPAEWIRVVITVLSTGAGYWATMYLLVPYFTKTRPCVGPGRAKGTGRGSRLGACAEVALLHFIGLTGQDRWPLKRSLPQHRRQAI